MPKWTQEEKNKMFFFLVGRHLVPTRIWKHGHTHTQLGFLTPTSGLWMTFIPSRAMVRRLRWHRVLKVLTTLVMMMSRDSSLLESMRAHVARREEHWGLLLIHPSIPSSSSSSTSLPPPTPPPQIARETCLGEINAHVLLVSLLKEELIPLFTIKILRTFSFSNQCFYFCESGNS